MSVGLVQAAGLGAAGVATIVVLCVVVLFVLIILASAIRILKEYERGVIFRLGRVQGR